MLEIMYLSTDLCMPDLHMLRAIYDGDDEGDDDDNNNNNNLPKIFLSTSRTLKLVP
jgi:hypothetical protein